MITLIITGIILCLLGSFILSRHIFLNKNKRVGIFLYTREETERRQKIADKKVKTSKMLDIFGLLLNVLGAICQVVALFLEK